MQNKELIESLLQDDKKFLVRLRPDSEFCPYIFEDGSEMPVNQISANIGKVGVLLYSLASESAYDFIREDNMNFGPLLKDKPRIVTLEDLDLVELVDIENMCLYNEYDLHIRKYFYSLEGEPTDFPELN